MGKRVLVVDDESAIREVLRLNLEAEGFEVITAPDASSGLREFRTSPCELAILDIMLPDGNGLDLARSLRESSDIPIIMLSARDTDVDKAVGLGMGADDYVTKPFSPVELVARVKAQLRRYDMSSAGNGRGVETLEAGPVRMDLGRRKACVRDVDIELTAKEFDILWMLAESPGRVYTKEQIYEHVWGEVPFGDLSTVHVHVRRLRTKIERNPDSPELVTTVYGIGYRFEEAE